MINTNELTTDIINAVKTLNSAQAMYKEMKANIVPITVDAVNATFERIEKVAKPIADVLQRIYASDADFKCLISNTIGTSKYYQGENYAKFTIVEVNHTFIPVIVTDHSDKFYSFKCTAKEDQNPIRFGYNNYGHIFTFPYSRVHKDITPHFETKMYEAIEGYVQAVINTLQNRAKSIIKDTNKITETLKQVAGDEAVNEVLYKNIHIGIVINSVSMTDKGVVVNICGTEYLLNASKL
jgi:hypothetical protein